MAESKKETAAPEGRFAYEGLARLMHERSRLGILTSLVSHPQGLAFNDLKKLCRLTDGNLSRQLAQLEEAGLVVQSKETTRQNRPQTRTTLTTLGKKRFFEYIAELERVVTDAAEALPANDARRRLSTA